LYYFFLLLPAQFIPYQKRNESECVEGCECRGAVVTCPTDAGKVMTIEAGRSGNTIRIKVDKVNSTTQLEIEQEVTEKNNTRIRARLSNERKAEIKVMPDRAEERALERIRLRVCSEENNCSLEIKEIKEKAKYEIQLQRHARILGLFRTKMRVRAEVDAENPDEEIKVDKPWWAFLATEPAE
jgi:hypothetical protein